MSKIMTMRDAVVRFVPHGSSVVMGAALESLIPFAAGHEIIRRQVRDLTMIGPISDILFDQLIGAGCVRKVIAAWVGNVSAGLGHNYRRACEQGIPHRLEVIDHSNFTISLALLAGGLGAPYIPTYSLLGTDIPRTNPTLRESISPFGGEKILLVPALQPDVAILHVQRSDENGNAHAWGNLGISEEAALASERIIIVAEEIVPHPIIVSDPNRVLAPSFKVCAVVHEPGGAHPSPVQGYYNRDHEYYHEYHRATRTAEGNAEWMGKWVADLKDRAGYFQKLGEGRRQGLQLKEHRYAAPVDYGY
ncbi:MAG: CoA transferase subunit A [Proteobacteria bacterium]|nr:CoA transferase subunit A [Pseudomonadota bacterium]MBU1964652.1 CoA transferase subunit A [Pseudomonadota bacterium]